MTTNTKTDTPQNGDNNRPTHTLRKPIGRGKNAGFETLGVAWDRGDGSLYIKPCGTQVIDGGFYAFPVQTEDADKEGAP